MTSRNKQYANEILDDIECYKAVLDGRLKQFPKGFWTKPWSLQSASVITRYLLEERLKYTEEDIKTKVGNRTFKDNKLTTLLRVFDNSPYAVINNAYPDRFKPWELAYISKGFWNNEDNIIKIVRWLVETKLDNNRERVCKEFNGNLLEKYGVSTVAKYGIYNILNMTYPNEFKPWELSSLPNGFWNNKNNVIEVVKWIVETKLDNNRERVCKEFNRELLRKYNLRTIARYGIYNLIDMTYPNQFKPWELGTVTNGFWNDENNIKQAVRWIVETKLDNNRDRVCKEMGIDIFYNNSLSGIAHIGVYKALDIAYPNEFKPWELSYTQQGFWDKEENVIDAVRWLVETKLDNNRERVKKEFNRKLLVENGLATPAQIRGVYELLDMAYQNEFKQSDFTFGNYMK